MISLTKYAGGKARLLPDILKVLQGVQSTCVVEPFGGSAKFLLNYPVFTLYGKRKVVYNDYDNRISNLFLQVRDHPDEMEQKFQYYIQSRDWYNKFKEEADDPIEDAFRVLYCLMLGRPERTFDVIAYTRDNRNDMDKVFTTLRQVHNVIKDWHIDNRDYSTVIKSYDSKDTLFYLDPPYLDTQMYNHNFDVDDFIRLKHALEKIKGKYLMNHYAHPTIEKIYGKPNLQIDYNNVVNNHNKDDGVTKLSRYEWFYWN